MSIFSNILLQFLDKNLKHESNMKDEIKFEEYNTVQIGKFNGIYKSSPNNCYFFAYDGYEKRIVAFTKSKVLYSCDKTIEGINTVCISNNGTALFTCPPKMRSFYGCTLYVYDSNGNALFEYKLKSNVFSIGISNDGNFCCCQTANSDDENSRNYMFIFSIPEKKALLKFSPLSGWANEYEFTNDNQVIILKYKNSTTACHKYRYKINGEFVDLKLWESEITGVTALFRAEYLLKDNTSFSQEKCNLIQDLLNRGNFPDMSSDYKAMSLKLQGVLYYNCKKYDEAESCFFKAIKFNEKVGVKRYLNKIKKINNGK